jgi:hypothetical protein
MSPISTLQNSEKTPSLQRCQPSDFIPRSWDFLKRLGYFWDFILRNETLGFFLGFLRKIIKFY